MKEFKIVKKKKISHNRVQISRNRRVNIDWTDLSRGEGGSSRGDTSAEWLTERSPGMATFHTCESGKFMPRSVHHTPS